MEEDGYPVLVTRNWDDVHSVMQLMPRQNGCVKCDTSAKLSCPTQCIDGTECGYEVLLDCTQCPKAVCVASSDGANAGAAPAAADASVAAGSDGRSSKPSIGAIAGGVIGGVVAAAVVIYMLWRFCIRGKRQRLRQKQQQQQLREVDTPTIYIADVDGTTVLEKDAASRRDQRSSTHTVHSVASTVLTRASNIIQIAYIPGVTNRAPPSSPAVLVPPVPPIPMGFAQAGGGDSPGGGGSSNPGSLYEDQHFFMPRDLRDSTYSNFSGYSDQTSDARTSYAPRSSIASTIYGRNVTIQAPQTGMRAKPTVVSVSVRSTGNSTDSEPPPVPSIDFDRYGRPKSGLSTFSIGSTFLNSASTATQVRAQAVKVANVKKANSSGSSASTASAERLSPLAMHSESATTANDPTTPPDQGPFSDPDEGKEEEGEERPSRLGAAIEDATRRAAKIKTRRTSLVVRGPSPFGDEHATRDE